MSTAVNPTTALPIIAQFESHGQNVLNCCATGACAGTSMCAPSAAGIPQTASGFFQITNTLWKSIAPKIGVDLSQYPTAMSAPAATQVAVATEVLSEHGLSDWAGDSKVVNAIANGSAANTTGFDPALLAALQNGNAQAQVNPTSWIQKILPYLPGGVVGTIPLPSPSTGQTVGSQPLSQTVSGIEDWLTKAGVEIGIAALAIGLIFFALTGTAQTVIKNVRA